MSRLKFRFLAPVLIIAVVLAALWTVGCQQLSPEERVAQMRSRYEATVNTGGFVVRPHEPEIAVLDDEEGETSEEGEAVGEEPGEETEPAPAEPTGYDVTLDILVSNRNNETLPQLTIDIVHADSAESEKGRYQATIDASRITKGGGFQVAHTLENIQYVEGDVFYTEVRHPVPESEKSKYPELANAGQ